MHDFEMLKYFKVIIQFLNAPKILEVIWKPPTCNWIKINCDRASLGNLGPSACGGITKDYEGHFLGDFSHILGVSNSHYQTLWCYVCN